MLRPMFFQHFSKYETFRMLDRCCKDYGLLLVGSIRLTPFLPFGLVTYGISLTDISLKYVLLGHITSVFGIFIMVVMGSRQQKAEQLTITLYQQDNVIYGVAIGLSVAVMVGVAIYAWLVARQFHILQQAQMDALLDHHETEGVPMAEVTNAVTNEKEESGEDETNQKKYDKYSTDGLAKKKKGAKEQNGDAQPESNTDGNQPNDGNKNNTDNEERPASTSFLDRFRRTTKGKPSLAASVSDKEEVTV